MDDETFIISTPRQPGKTDFVRIEMKCKRFNPAFIGVDWAKDSGMNRGDVILREGNVIYAQFKTVEPSFL